MDMSIPRENREFMTINVTPRLGATGRTMGMANQIAIANAMFRKVPKAVCAFI
jgi:hypothetical protein